jgi:hypothetical protein
MATTQKVKTAVFKFSAPHKSSSAEGCRCNMHVDHVIDVPPESLVVSHPFGLGRLCVTTPPPPLTRTRSFRPMRMIPPPVRTRWGNETVSCTSKQGSNSVWGAPRRPGLQQYYYTNRVGSAVRGDDHQPSTTRIRPLQSILYQRHGTNRKKTEPRNQKHQETESTLVGTIPIMSNNTSGGGPSKGT